MTAGEYIRKGDSVVVSCGALWKCVGNNENRKFAGEDIVFEEGTFFHNPYHRYLVRDFFNNAVWLREDELTQPKEKKMLSNEEMKKYKIETEPLRKKIEQDKIDAERKVCEGEAEKYIDQLKEVLLEGQIGVMMYNARPGTLNILEKFGYAVVRDSSFGYHFLGIKDEDWVEPEPLPKYPPPITVPPLVPTKKLGEEIKNYTLDLKNGIQVETIAGEVMVKLTANIDTALEAMSKKYPTADIEVVYVDNCAVPVVVVVL